MERVRETLERLAQEAGEALSCGEPDLKRLLGALSQCEMEVRGALGGSQAASPQEDAPEGSTTAEQMQARARKIGHDLNNSLGVISGRAELLGLYLSRGNAEGAQKAASSILSQSQKMSQLTAALRDLSAPEDDEPGPS